MSRAVIPLVTLPNKPDTYIRTVEPGTYLLETKVLKWNQMSIAILWQVICF